MDKFLTLKGADVDLSGAPEIIPILPLGHVKSQKGEFIVDTESLESMKAGIAQRGIDVVIDYEHQTLDGVQAPAAGWIKDIMLKDGHIQARVEWTPRAAEYLKNREYRYGSPVITVRKSDNKAVGLHSLALTNTPAIDGMTPIVNSQNFKGGQNKMDLLKKLAQLLGLADTATEEEIAQSVEAALAKETPTKEETPPTAAVAETVVANKAPAANGVNALLGLAADAPISDVTNKIMELKGGIVDGVNLHAEVLALKQQNAQREAEIAVQMALKSGKITPGQKVWALTYALESPEGFASFVKASPVTVPLGEISMTDDVALSSDKPDAATTMILKQLDVSEEDYAKYGKG